MKNRKFKRILLAAVSIVVAACAMFAVGCADKNGDKNDDKPPCAHASVSAHVEREPSCTDDGLTSYVCDSCRETVREEVTPASGHDYSQAETTGKCVTCGDTICSPGMTYELTDDERGYIVSDTKRKSGANVVIPEYHDGKPVVEIASDAFNARTDIESVSIPKTIETINVGAFNGSTKLKQIYYNAENAADFRGINWVFYFSSNAPQLSVTIGKNVKRIPARLFYPHNANNDVIPYIERLEFENGSKLESIGEYAFYKTNLETVSFPDTLKTLGAHAFESSAVSTPVFGKAFKTVGAHAFDYCLGLKTVDLTATALESVEESAFRNCGELTSVKLPQTLESVRNKAFYGCVKLKEIEFGGLTSVGEEAFKGCSALESLTLPAALETIGRSAFEGCSGLKSITVNAVAPVALEAGNRAFFGAGAQGGISVYISDGVRAIPERLFYSTADIDNNIRISRLYIAVGVQSIGSNAFRGVTVDKTDFAGTAAQYAKIDIADGNGAIGTPSFGVGRA